MQTDIPLKVLTAACAADLLPLLGAPDAQVLAVESLELPATARAVDNVLHLRPRGAEPYLHLVEWQGYRDPLFLWRVLTYLAWLGLHRTERPIVVTVVYLSPDADVGERLEQRMATFHVVRLWERDAAAAVAGGRVGMAVLSPLMQGATPDLVEQAAQVVLREAEAGQRQADLLTILGVLAEPLVPAERFVQMLGKERLMASDLISYLFADKVAEWEAERARLEAEREAERARLEAEREAERARLEADLAAALVGSVQDAVLVRFPHMPAALVEAIGTVRDTDRLRRLHHAVLTAADQVAVEELLRENTGVE